MIIEELKKIKSFGSDIKSTVTPEDIAVKEAELGFALPQALQEYSIDKSMLFTSITLERVT